MMPKGDGTHSGSKDKNKKGIGFIEKCRIYSMRCFRLHLILVTSKLVLFTVGNEVYSSYSNKQNQEETDTANVCSSQRKA